MTTMPEAAPQGRLRRWAPALAGLALAGVGLAAAGVASQGLRLTIGPAEAPPSGPDPLALLRDDVASMRAAQDELGQQTGAGLEALDRASAGRADALAARADALAARVERMLERQRALEARVAALASAAPPGSSAPTSGPTSTPAAAAPPPVPDAAPEPAPPEPAPAAAGQRPGLFAWKTSGPDLDERLRFELVPSLSRVGFDAKSTLHDFTGVTSDVEGWLEARLGAPADAHAEVTARAATLRTGVDGRDEEMRKRLDTERHPAIVFVLRSITAPVVDRERRTIAGEARGDLTIHGVTRPVVVPVRASLDPSRRLVVEGEARVTMSSHGIEPPDVGPIVVEDEVRLWLSLRMRSVGKAAEDRRP